MKRHSDHDHEFDLPGLWQALEDLEDGTLDAAKRDEIMELLKCSPAARRAYFEFFQQSAVLRMEAAKMEEQGLLPLVNSTPITRRAFPRWAMAAAALVMLAAIVASLVVINRPMPSHFAATALPETQWSIDHIAQHSTRGPVTVTEGSTVRIASGSVRLALPSGNQLLLRGPAEAAFPSLYRPQIRQGWLWIDASKADKPFQVGAAGIDIRDIGTRFGVRVPTNGPAEVHLIDGRVRAFAADSGKLLGDLGEAGKAFAVTTDGISEELPLAADPFPDLPERLAQPADYRSTVLGQGPVGYWPCDDSIGQPISNIIRGGTAGVYREKGVQLHYPGVRPEDGFHGFPETNDAFFLTGDRTQTELSGLGGPRGVNFKEGAVSFWILRLRVHHRREEVLWLAGTSGKDPSAPAQAILHTRLTTSGQFLFILENGTADVILSSPDDIADGKWHHVVASWNPRSADLYVDGRLVGSNHQPRTSYPPQTKESHVSFGQPRLNLPHPLNCFLGGVDEIVLWDRPLSPTEVGIQYQSALGTAADSGK